jgi:hypothetical protein
MGLLVWHDGVGGIFLSAGRCAKRNAATRRSTSATAAAFCTGQYASAHQGVRRATKAYISHDSCGIAPLYRLMGLGQGWP